MSPPRRLAYSLLACLMLSGIERSRAEDEPPKPFPKNSPEHQALTASSPYLGNDAFTLRNDYWTGTVSTLSGTAVRLQFFKGNIYRLFFGVGTDQFPEGARLHLHIFDEKSDEVISASGEAGQAAVVLNFEKVRKTGLYLVLMRIEPRPGPAAEVLVPSVLFYGWE
ncbi:MAG: hypothetical protein KDM63_16505 [Verrucomicrobiae bacterium]|nr:hypothetical protein [Verrucomicrobiae bacterium]MCB1091755.1 hypothetical protein [Verrucomicrobiae bacterium]